MHGRLKVKTTAEQAEAKRKEREKKLKIYSAATQKVFEKRKNKKFDEEALCVSGEILAVNPDFYTLWNFRKEIFQALKEQKTSDELNKLFNDELYFLETCLKMNPKSYGSWNHRCYVMNTMPQPDWKRELALCNKFLEYDERNFHCWDYRRFVVQNAKVPPTEEFEFSTSKISSNFSNYSSWHYRSKLLPLIEPDKDQPVGITEQALLKEFEIVQNAFFTDPEDQSAWFYHRWLLGRGERKLDVQSIYLSRQLGTVTVGLTKPILLRGETSIRILVNGAEMEGEWRTPWNRHRYSSVWVFTCTETALLTVDDKLTMDVHLKICTDDEPIETIVNSATFTSSEDRRWKLTESKQGTYFSHELSAATSSILTTELESCQELHDLEPDNKWALLTIVLLMKSLNPLKYEEEITNNLGKLETLDSKRRNYYRDLKSRFLIENMVERLDGSSHCIDLSGRGLTTIYHHHILLSMREINLSKNQLSSLKNFCLFQGVEKLNLSENLIDDVSGISGLPILQELCLQHNQIRSAACLSGLADCPRLETIHLGGNPCCKTEDFQEKLKSILPKIKIVV